MFYDVYLKLCEERGEKPYQLALKLGASSNSIVYQWSKGSKPRSDMMMKLAEYFDVPVAYLLTGDESLRTKEKPATEVTGNERLRLQREIAERIAKLSPQNMIKVIGYLDSLIEKGESL